ncbi:MAG: hypothetical protein OXL37_17415 [Chloroflexota bacterium]|nr:hypothetical protein [Chloroflexota bacterium]MDE2960437.1 hypothetical protein [Chloroflexota bacterium]
MRRRHSLESYDLASQDDITLYLAPGISEYAQQVSLSMSRFLLFRNLKATIVLPHGVTLGRRASLV